MHVTDFSTALKKNLGRTLQLLPLVLLTSGIASADGFIQMRGKTTELEDSKRSTPQSPSQPPAATTSAPTQPESSSLGTWLPPKKDASSQQSTKPVGGQLLDGIKKRVSEAVSQSMEKFKQLKKQQEEHLKTLQEVEEQM